MMELLLHLCLGEINDMMHLMTSTTHWDKVTTFTVILTIYIVYSVHYVLYLTLQSESIYVLHFISLLIVPSIYLSLSGWGEGENFPSIGGKG